MFISGYFIIAFVVLETAFTWVSARINTASPILMTNAAIKSKTPLRFLCINMPPINTGISLQLLKIT